MDAIAAVAAAADDDDDMGMHGCTYTPAWTTTPICDAMSNRTCCWHMHGYGST